MSNALVAGQIRQIAEFAAGCMVLEQYPIGFWVDHGDHGRLRIQQRLGSYWGLPDGWSEGDVIIQGSGAAFNDWAIISGKGSEVKALAYARERVLAGT